MKNYRNTPIKIACGPTKHRVINQIIFEEYINKPDGWANRAIERLKKYRIEITKNTLLSYRRKLISGLRDPSTVSLYGGTSNSNFTSRYGKDGMYLQFKLWCDIFVSEPRYIGLPANQILAVSKDFSPEKVVACEKDKSRCEHMKKMQTYFSEPPYATIKNADIFKFLMNTNIKFSIYDFDLMCHISQNVIEKVVSAVARTSMKRAGINIATTIGRKITESQHNNMVPSLILDACKNKNLEVIKYYCNGYNDRVMPMRYIFLAINNRRVDEVQI